jgi:hypothetical protein
MVMMVVRRGEIGAGCNRGHDRGKVGRFVQTAEDAVAGGGVGEMDQRPLADGDLVSAVLRFVGQEAAAEKHSRRRTRQTHPKPPQSILEKVNFHRWSAYT